MEGILLDESGPEHEVAVLFRDLCRPDYLFGYRVEAVEIPDVPGEATSRHTDLPSAVQMWAADVWVLFEEEVFASGYRLPRYCSREAVTWIGERAPARHDRLS